MLRRMASKVAWVGRTASMVFGLALVMALVFGVATMAFGADGQNFILGKLNNAATTVTGLVGNVNGSAMQVANTNAGTNDTALDLRVQTGEAPMRVNSGTRVAKLNADKLDGKDSSVFLRDAYLRESQSFYSTGGTFLFCKTSDYTPTRPQTALIDINASLAAGPSNAPDVHLRATYSIDGGMNYHYTSDQAFFPFVDIPAEKQATLGYLDALPLQPGVTYRFAVKPLGGPISHYEPSHCQVLVTFINR